MPRGLSRSRRLATAARWPVGIALTSWQYMWRTTPMHRAEVAGSVLEDGPPPLPAGLPDESISPQAEAELRLAFRDWKAGSAGQD